ncbi:FecR domain-containing protein [Agathobaculum sp.]|uniref:FecR domain-containing protein n=1 Tax=Agathobaculum sp. TaxID=2048138 RepID=UPI002A83B78F|nr:FecR domain-containing protein [Agathobaculum sp.]MDY3617636.1 FecR domain-containing protein [Agathobaculum sp.]
MKLCKQLLAAMLAVLMVSAPAMAGAAQTSATSRSISILSVEGSNATVNKGGKKSVSATKGMRLASGYTITTGKSTTVYFQVDDDKAIKLAASSSATISTATGKKLKITLKSGSMFFNVKKPLSSDSSMSVSAGGTSMSVRGTSGYVSLLNDQPAAGLFSGKVVWTVEGEEHVITAGEQMVSSGAEITKTALTLDSAPAFAAVAALENSDTIDLTPYIPEDADLKELEAELNSKWQAEQAAIDKAADEAADQAAAVKPDPQYDAGKPSGGGGGSSSVTPPAVHPVTSAEITGSSTVGNTLTAHANADATAPLTYQWYRDGAEISGAVSSTYTTAAADLNQTLTVKISGANSSSVTSAAFGPVSPLPDELQSVAPVSANITKDKGAAFADLGLPATTSVTASQSGAHAANIQWNESSFNANLYNTAQTITGTVQLDGIVNPSNIPLSVSATVTLEWYVVSIPASVGNTYSYSTNTPVSSLSFPMQVTITTNDGTETANITWDYTEYEATSAFIGTKSLNGTVTLPSGLANKNGIELKTTVTYTLT